MLNSNISQFTNLHFKIYILKTYNLQLTIYPLQLTPYNLPLTTYPLQLIPYNLSLTTYPLQFTIQKVPPAGVEPATIGF